MEIIEVTSQAYAKIIPEPYYIYGNADFNELNSGNCEVLHFLLFKEGKYRLGIIGGCKNNVFCSPFSAPFGGFSYLSQGVRLHYIENALDKMEDWVSQKGMSSVYITLPPSVYNENFISKQTNCLFRKGYDVYSFDLSYSLLLDDFGLGYEDKIWENARRNLRIAFRRSLNFNKCESEEEKKLVYEIIYKNHQQRGYPLRMSWHQVYETSRIVPSDFFIVYHNQSPVASAIFFSSAPGIVHLIYWGDLREFGGNKPMNFFTYKIFEYYKSLGMKIVDIGPSTENSIPNYGLGEFKESIGCKIHNKLTFRKELN